MFVLAKLFWGLVAPGNALAWLGGVGVVLRRVRIARHLLAGVALLWLLLAVVPVGDGLLRPLEERFPPPGLPAVVDGIIVLGGAVVPGISQARGQPAVNQAAERMIEFVALAQRYPQARRVFSGGSGLLREPDLAEAPVAAALFARLGLAPDTLVLEDRSRNTRENALYTQALVRPQPGERWLLVTSAAHMPRAVGVFQRLGWSVIPYPCDYRTRPDDGSAPFLRFDLLWGLELMDTALREWLGLLSYWLRDWTPRLFPAPEATAA